MRFALFGTVRILLLVYMDCASFEMVFFSFVVYLKILKEKEKKKKKKKKGRKKKRAIKKQRKGNLHCYDKLHKVYCCSPWMFHTQDDYGCFKLFSLVDRGVKR